MPSSYDPSQANLNPDIPGLGLPPGATDPGGSQGGDAVGNYDPAAGNGQGQAAPQQRQEPSGPPAPPAEPAGQPAVQQPQQPPQPPAAPPSTPPSTLIRDRMAQQGYPVGDFQDDEELLSAIQERYELAQSAPPEDELEQFRRMQPTIREYAENSPEFHEWLKQREQQQAQLGQADPNAHTGSQPAGGSQAAGGGAERQKAAWEPLEYNPDWDAVTEWDSKQQVFVPKGPYGSLRAAQERNEYHRRVTERAKRLTSDPMGLLEEAGLPGRVVEAVRGNEDLRKELREEIKQAVLDEIRQQEATQSRDSFFEQNKDKFFVLDQQTGQQRLDPRTRQPILTELGQKYRDAYQEGQEFGIQDEGKLHEYAMKHSGFDASAGDASSAGQQHGAGQQQNGQQQNGQQQNNGQDAQNNGASPGQGASARDRNRDAKGRFLSRARSQRQEASRQPGANDPNAGNRTGAVAAAARLNQIRDADLDWDQMARESAAEVAPGLNF